MIRVRLSPGADPVIEIEAAHLRELDVFLRSMSAEGVYSALKGAAREFADAPLAASDIEAMLGGQEIDPGPPWDIEAEKRQVREWNQLATERAIAKGDIPNPADEPGDVVVGTVTHGGPVDASPLRI